MNESVAHPASVAGGLGIVVVSDRPPEHLPPAAIGDLAQLLDVDMDEFTGAFSLIAADDSASGAVHPSQAIEAEADQHPVHRRGGHAQAIADSGWAQLEL